MAGIVCSWRDMSLHDADGPLAARHVESTPTSVWRALVTLWLVTGSAGGRQP